MHRVTAPPAPSPKLPSSSIVPSRFAAFHPRSSRSSASSGAPFSKVSFLRCSSKSNELPCMLFSLSMPTPLCAELEEYAAESGSRSTSAKLIIEYDDAVDTDPFAPKLFVLLCAESSLLPPPGVRPPPGMINGGPLLLLCWFSCGACLVPIGVATLSFGGCCLPGIDNGGRFDIVSLMSGTAALLTSLCPGLAGIARPSRGSLLPVADRPPPGMGGRNKGAGLAILGRSGGGSRVK